MLSCVNECEGPTGRVLDRHGDVAAGQGQLNDTVAQGQGRVSADMFRGDIPLLYGLTEALGMHQYLNLINPLTVKIFNHCHYFSDNCILFICCAICVSVVKILF